jgi:integrase
MVESRLTGTRRRKFFRHNEAQERDEYVAEIEGSMDTLAKADRSILADAQLLEEASRASKALARHDKSIADAAAFYLAHLDAEASRDSITVSEVVRRFLDEKEREGISERHRLDLRNRLNRFKKDHGEAPIASLDRNAISKWILGLTLAPQSKVNFRRALSNLFGYAVRSEVIATNPVRDAAAVKVRRKKTEILTPDEVSNLLTHCPEVVLPAMVLQVFCGVRNAEAFRLSWQDIDWEDSTIEISAHNAKREGHARHSTIPPNAQAWLRTLAQTRGPLAPFDHFHNFTKALQEARKAAGWEPGAWPDNALRKTFISCHYESWGSIDETAKEAGTSVGIIHRHYRKLIKKKEADKLWEIWPAENSSDSPVARANPS